MQKNKLIHLLSFLFGVFLLSACEYATTKPDVPPPPPPGDSTSFSLKVQPIFNATCTRSGCHDGRVTPDLRSGKSYEALMSMEPETVIPFHGADSELYKILQPGGSMASYGNPTDNATIKFWIDEGAKNN
ncbi:MAG: hypothetical protein M0Q38_00575 [Bacteroidales bacterium]|jgi:hypothetical protein|nr:hypothetical protein [Bacteroidales bacterium]